MPEEEEAEAMAPDRKVYLHVYHLIVAENKRKGLPIEALEFLGLGLFHGAVAVYDKEYSFGGLENGHAMDLDHEGIFITHPQSLDNFKESICLGETALSKDEVRTLVRAMRPDWKAHTYHLVHKNCHDFCAHLAKALGPGLADNIPAWVNRAARSGGRLVPEHLLARLHPPLSVPEGLEGKIGVPFKGPPPDSLSVAPTTNLSLPVPSPTSARHRRYSADAAGNPDDGVRRVSPLRMRVDAIRDRHEAAKFASLFPALAQEAPLAIHRCEVVHLGRMCTGTLFLTPQSLCFSGAKGLQEAVALHDIQSVRYHRDADHMTFELLPVDAAPQDAAGVSVYTQDTLYRFHRFRHGAAEAMGHLLAAWKAEPVPGMAPPSPSHSLIARRRRSAITL